MSSLLDAKDTEIEKKFLVSGDAWKNEVGQSFILHQAYFNDEGTDKRIRLNVPESEAVVAYKQDIDVIEGFTRRVEKETAVDFFYGLAIFMKTACFIKKRRSLIALGDFTIEVDEFLNLKQPYANLVTAEIEVKEHQIAQFQQLVLPSWLSKDISEEKHYSNYSLQRHTVCDMAAYAEVLKMVPTWQLKQDQSNSNIKSAKP